MLRVAMAKPSTKREAPRVGRTAGKSEEQASKTVVRTSISLTNVVYEWAQTQAEKQGFLNNFSGYIADLVRRDKVAQDEREARLRSLNPDQHN